MMNKNLPMTPVSLRFTTFGDPSSGCPCYAGGLVSDHGSVGQTGREEVSFGVHGDALQQEVISRRAVQPWVGHCTALNIDQ